MTFTNILWNTTHFVSLVHSLVFLKLDKYSNICLRQKQCEVRLLEVVISRRKYVLGGKKKYNKII